MTSWRRLLEFLAMGLVSLVVAHDLVFLLAYGAAYPEALAHSGHDGAWSTAVVVVVTAGLGLFGLTSWRLHRLGVLARTLARTVAPAGGPPGPSASAFAGLVVRLWLALTWLTACLFVVQENLEHARIGATLPGLSVLGSAGYPNATLIIAIVTLAIAFVGALFHWRAEILGARIAAALQRARRWTGSRVRRPILDRDGRPQAVGGRGHAVRAPPALPFIQLGTLEVSATPA